MLKNLKQRHWDGMVVYKISDKWRLRSLGYVARIWGTAGR